MWLNIEAQKQSKLLPPRALTQHTHTPLLPRLTRRIEKDQQTSGIPLQGTPSWFSSSEYRAGDLEEGPVGEGGKFVTGNQRTTGRRGEGRALTRMQPLRCRPRRHLPALPVLT